MDDTPVSLPAVRADASGAVDFRSAAVRLVSMFLAGRKATTIRAYRQDLADFAAFLQASSAEVAAGVLLDRGPGAANALAMDYRSHLQERKLSSATINRRLAALRSLIKLARVLGMVSWSLEVQGLKAEGYRDTRGPGEDGFAKLLAAIGRSDAKGQRDRALLRLLYDLALRRAEVVGLDLEDWDREKGTLAVLGKGRNEKTKLTMPPETQQALTAWVEARGAQEGALFVTLSHCGKGKRLSGTGLYLVIRSLGRRVRLKTWPHGLRHAAITKALDATGGNIRMVQKFSRHRDVRVLERYDDTRQDLAGDVAKKVASGAIRPAA